MTTYEDFIRNNKLFHYLEYNFIIPKPYLDTKDYIDPNKYFTMKPEITKPQLTIRGHLLSHFESFLLVYTFNMKIQLSPSQIIKLYNANKNFEYITKYVSVNDYLYRHDILTIIMKMWYNWYLSAELEFYNESIPLADLCRIFDHLYTRAFIYFNVNIPCF
jgi:hypothetical protein